MKPLTPYLLPALYEWLLDSGCKPYLLVDANRPEVQVPESFVRDGRIVLNISPQAVANVHMSTQELRCQARFSGVSHTLHIPMTAVLAIYDQDSGHGVQFSAPVPDEVAEETEESRTVPGEQDAAQEGGVPHLRLVQ